MIKKTKNIIGQYRRSEDGKKVASNFSLLMVLQVASYGFPLLTVPYLARVIGVDGFGKIAFAAAVMLWFQTIVDWGFSYTATRDLARNRNDIDKVSKIFSNVFWSRIFLTLISFVLLASLIFIVPYFNKNKDILAVTFLIVPTAILFPEWFFQGMEKMKYITIFNVISKTAFTALVFVLIRDKGDYIYQPALIAIGNFLVGLVSIFLIVHVWKVKLVWCTPKEILATIKESSDVFINNISRNFYNSFSVVILGVLGGSNATGLLDAGRKFVGISKSFMGVFEKAFLPFLARKIEFHDSYAKITLFVSIVGSVALYNAAPVVINIFYTHEFSESVLVLKIMAFSIVAATLNSIYGLNYLVILGYEKLARNITVSVSFIFFLSAFPAVYYLGYKGAAINIVLAQFALGFSMLVFSRKIKRTSP